MQPQFNHLSAANRRFRFPPDALSWFGSSVCARRPLPAPVAERERWAGKGRLTPRRQVCKLNR
jgi:hypothetical protein